MMQFRRDGPYKPTHQSGGEVPSVVPDVPVSIVLLLIFLGIGVGHLSLFIRNKKRGIKFIFNGMSFGLCNVRVFTFALRMAWSTHPTNIRLGIASGIFVYAGTIILYIVNLFFAQRIVRAQHPSIGWSKPFGLIPVAGIIFCITTLCILIVAIIQQFYTLDQDILRIDKDLQKYGQVVFTTLAFLPIPIVTISSLCGQLLVVKQRRFTEPVDKFGQGRMTNKVALSLVSAVLLSLEAGFRCGTTFAAPVPLSISQPWYYTKAAFYSFNFIPELLVVMLWLVARIDVMYHIPNGANGSYKHRQQVEDDAPEKRVVTHMAFGRDPGESGSELEERSLHTRDVVNLPTAQAQ